MKDKIAVSLSVAIIFLLLGFAFFYKPVSASGTDIAGTLIPRGGIYDYPRYDTYSPFDPELMWVGLSNYNGLPALPSIWPYDYDHTIIWRTPDGYVFINYDVSLNLHSVILNNFSNASGFDEIFTNFCVAEFWGDRYYANTYLDPDTAPLVHYCWEHSSEVRSCSSFNLFLNRNYYKNDEWNGSHFVGQLTWFPIYYKELIIPQPFEDYDEENFYFNAYRATSNTVTPIVGSNLVFRGDLSGMLVSGPKVISFDWAPNGITYTFDATGSAFYSPSSGYPNSVPLVTPTNTPRPTNTPTNSPRPSNTSIPTNTPTNSPRPTSTSVPTNSPRPTNTSGPTSTPLPADLTSVPVVIVSGIPTQAPNFNDWVMSPVPTVYLEPFEIGHGNAAGSMVNFIDSLNNLSNQFLSSFNFVRDGLQTIYSGLGFYQIILLISLGIGIFVIILRFLR